MNTWGEKRESWGESSIKMLIDCSTTKSISINVKKGESAWTPEKPVVGPAQIDYIQFNDQITSTVKIKPKPVKKVKK